MPLYLLYADKLHFRNSTGRNAAIVNAATPTAAATLAQANAPDGETKNVASWAVAEIAATLTAGAQLPASNVIWLQGQVAEPLQPSSGK
jgi:hypothetical protein